jgi:hypothetical protein
LKEIAIWCGESKLTQNTKKTEYLILGTAAMKKKAQPIELRIGKDKLREGEKYSYLDTTLDPRLNLKPQIARLNKQLARKLNSFRKMRSCMSESTATLVYRAIILPIIDYNDIIHGFAIKQQETKIQ